MAFIKEESEDVRIEEAFRVKEEETEEQTDLMALKEDSEELRDPPTGKGVEAGSVTAATWQWYSAMDAALQGQHSISPPLVVASNLTATTGGSVSTSASTPSASPKSSQNSRKRPRESQALLDFLKEQAERDEEREKEAIAREEERERAAAARAERYLSLFENLINKI
ncbi:hypothetical protein QQF64_033812 [Cirrhinus molitorella]|uniref:Uncharacterized protein n=1 Tax=Cirrhinus molitorella TaxID=172907 RepID=A0ABR3MUY3_9TELE